jgi:hypothetical protein
MNIFRRTNDKRNMGIEGNVSLDGTTASYVLHFAEPMGFERMTFLSDMGF